MLRPAANPNSGWLFCKIFSEDSFAACGRIHILQGGVKASKSVKDNTYVRLELFSNGSFSLIEPVQMFYVLDGAVNVKVHETQYIVCTDGLFIVPRGSFLLPVNYIASEVDHYCRERLQDRKHLFSDS